MHTLFDRHSDPRFLVELLVSADDIVSAIRAGSQLLAGIVERTWNPAETTSLSAALETSFESGDALYRSFALRALAASAAPTAEARIIDSLTSDDVLSRRAGAWAAVGHVSTAMASPLIAMLSGGHFDRMLAQLALVSSASSSPRAVAAEVDLQRCAVDPSQPLIARIAAIECLARFPATPGTLNALRTLACTVGANFELVAAAVRALGDLRDESFVPTLSQLTRSLRSTTVTAAALESLGCMRDPRARHALVAFQTQSDRWSRLELTSLQATATQALNSIDRVRRPASPRHGLHIAQMSLRGAIDVDLRSAGEGDGGGLATLLVQLARAFGRNPAIERAYTVTRASAEDSGGARHIPRIEPIQGASSHLVRIPFGPAGAMAAEDTWGSVLHIERALRLFFASVPLLDGIHLRFADAGTWAAARWAKASSVPIHFTLAPDPYVPIRSAQAAGGLCRSSFAAAEEREQYLFRAHILDWMVEHASGLALLPRPNWKEDAPMYFGLDSRSFTAKANQQARVRVIAEGIAVQPQGVQHEKHDIKTWKHDLTTYIQRDSRRCGKPVLLTVGRLHEVKGVARLVEAWAGDRGLRDAFNMVVVGGKLASPSAHETRVLYEIGETLRRYPAASPGLTLLGSRSNDDVSLIMAAMRTGIPGVVAPNSVYVCASDKEEFGLAILEAMGAGLVVVAPNHGGPPTYITHGVTGLLANTRDVAELRSAIRLAACIRENARDCIEMTDKAGQLVRDTYSIDRMATELVDLYGAFAPSVVRAQAAS